MYHFSRYYLQGFTQAIKNVLELALSSNDEKKNQAERGRELKHSDVPPA